jgi:hypothetical protein
MSESSAAWHRSADAATGSRFPPAMLTQNARRPGPDDRSRLRLQASAVTPLQFNHREDPVGTFHTDRPNRVGPQ